MVLEVLLTQYGRTLEQQFQIQINSDACTITDLSVFPGYNSNIVYDITSPPQGQLEDFPLLDVTPFDCIQSYSYQIVFAGTQTSPDFVTIQGNGFEILSNDPNDVQSYDLELLITPDGPNDFGTLPVPYTLKIRGCVLDKIEVGNPLGSILYQISNGPSTVSGDFQNSYPQDCPQQNEYKLVQQGYQGPGDFDPAIFTFSTNSPTVTIETNDLNLRGQVFALELTAIQAQTSGNSVTDFFTIELTDGCDQVTLQPVIIQTASPTTVSLYEPLFVFFD